MSLTGNLFIHLTSTQKCKSLYCSPTILKDSICTTLLAVAWIYIYIKFKGIYQPENLMSNGSSRHDDAAQTK